MLGGTEAVLTLGEDLELLSVADDGSFPELARRCILVASREKILPLGWLIDHER